MSPSAPFPTFVEALLDKLSHERYRHCVYIVSGHDPDSAVPRIELHVVGIERDRFRDAQLHLNGLIFDVAELSSHDGPWLSWAHTGPDSSALCAEVQQVFGPIIGRHTADAFAATNLTIEARSNLIVSVQDDDPWLDFDVVFANHSDDANIIYTEKPQPHFVSWLRSENRISSIRVEGVRTASSAFQLGKAA